MPISTSHLLNHFKYQDNNSQRVLSEFKKPIFSNIFFRNLDYLLRKCNSVKFDKDRWIMRPHIFCEDYYGIQYFYPVILLVNNLGSIFDFSVDNFISRKILVPPESEIINVLNLPNL